MVSVGLAPPAGLAEELAALCKSAGLVDASTDMAPTSDAFWDVWEAVSKVWASKWTDRAWLRRATAREREHRWARRCADYLITRSGHTALTTPPCPAALSLPVAVASAAAGPRASRTAPSSCPSFFKRSSPPSTLSSCTRQTRSQALREISSERSWWALERRSSATSRAGRSASRRPRARQGAAAPACLPVCAVSQFVVFEAWQRLTPGGVSSRRCCVCAGGDAVQVKTLPSKVVSFHVENAVSLIARCAAQHTCARPCLRAASPIPHAPPAPAVPKALV